MQRAGAVQSSGRLLLRVRGSSHATLSATPQYDRRVDVWRYQVWGAGNLRHAVWVSRCCVCSELPCHGSEGFIERHLSCGQQ